MPKKLYLESLKMQEFIIDFHNQTIKNNTLSMTFSAVFQSTSKQIESYLKITWPYLLQHQEYSMEQLKELQKMKKYIQKRLSQEDIRKLHKTFYDKSWFQTLIFNMNLTEMSLTDFNAKFWTDPELPYLEIKGIITLNLENMLDTYLQKGFIKAIKPYKQKITRENLVYKFVRPLPLFVTFRGGDGVRSIILKMFKDRINSKNINLLRKMTENEMKIDKIHEYKKEITWKFQDEISVEITDTIQLLKLKAKKNILPMVGGYLLYRNLRNK